MLKRVLVGGSEPLLAPVAWASRSARCLRSLLWVRGLRYPRLHAAAIISASIQTSFVYYPPPYWTAGRWTLWP